MYYADCGTLRSESMKKILICFLALLIVAGFLFGQEAEENTQLSSYLRNFARASLSTKIQILQDAERVDLEGMGPLYEKAVEFVIDNQMLLKADNAARQLAIIAVRLIGDSGYTEAKYELWDLFTIEKETLVRVQCMESLGVVGTGDKRIIDRINSWVSQKNTLFMTGQKPDYQVFGAAIDALGNLGDPSSFPIIFTSMSLSFSEDITKRARNALYNIEGEFTDLIVRVIEQNSILEKLSALQLALSEDRLSEDEKGEVAEKALEIGLETTTPDASEKAQLREMRYTAIRALTERNWSRATPLVIRHFDITVMEYDRGIARKGNFLEAIAGLGAMATHEAAVRLNLYLDLLNTYKEQERAVDEQIILAVINNLGKLGDKVAIDNLLYVGYLNYSQTVKNAAREAINNLRT
mgnify:CR=1 FL=1